MAGEKIENDGYTIRGREGLCEKAPSKARQEAGQGVGAAAAKLVSVRRCGGGSNLNGAAFGHGKKEPRREGGARNTTTFRAGCANCLSKVSSLDPRVPLTPMEDLKTGSGTNIACNAAA